MKISVTHEGSGRVGPAAVPGGGGGEGIVKTCMPIKDDAPARYPVGWDKAGI